MNLLRYRAQFVLLSSLVSAFFSPTSFGRDATFRSAVESDWQIQEQQRYHPQQPVVTPEMDAAGGCDGVKNGQWGFHTEFSENPWWQVDLGAETDVGRIQVWNRCDGGSAPRTEKMEVLLSSDGTDWRTVYRHDGTVFLGFPDNKPLNVSLQGEKTRFVRVQIPGQNYLHLDEVEVFGAAALEKNLALGRPANQSSISQWSVNHLPPAPPDYTARALAVLDNCRRTLPEIVRSGTERLERRIDRLQEQAAAASNPEETDRIYKKARWMQRKAGLSDSLFDFDDILFVKRVPGSYSHMSDQYYGWWSRPGGGLYILHDWKSDSPTAECITGAFTEPGSFLRPSLSYDGTKVLFAWCKHYPDLAAEKDKENKNNVPEDAFFHVFEMNIDGTGARQLTHGKYDDFDARYLPDGRIVFLSTRRGQAIQCGQDTALRTVSQTTLPDCYVRCGGGPERPVAVYTLHTMDADGGDLCAISPFEMFEWTPSVSNDGTILYSRWDYIDRSNMPYMSLWSIHPDGTHSRIVYGNFTLAPHCTFEPQCVPGSNKIIFTASAHHAQTMGSLVLLDPTVGTEGPDPIKRLTPEVVFPEIEGWPTSSFSSPWPLSERFHLVAWGCVSDNKEGKLMVPNAMGLYLFDAELNNLELLHRDPEITCENPIPLRARPKPPVIPNAVKWDSMKEGRFLMADVYRGLRGVERGRIKSLRIVAVPAKTQPTMNSPEMGITRDDPGKCVLGTVPVEEDGSAFFRVPAGVTMFFQALDARGMAIQTMRSATHVQPGQTLSCVGCHESRMGAPVSKPVTAAVREASKLTPGPDGSWPFRFDRLVQPVLTANCVKCHGPGGKKSDFDLTAEKAWTSLCNYGKPSLVDYVRARYAQGASAAGEGPAVDSPLLALLTKPEGHHGVKLERESLEKLITWLDVYGQKLGAFSEDQERDLLNLRVNCRDLLAEYPSGPESTNVSMNLTEVPAP